MIDISLNKDKKILIWTHIGEITEFDLIGAIDKTKTFSGKISNLRILELNNDSFTKLGVTKAVEIARNAKKHFYLFDSVKHAFVSNKPINIALFVMINSYINKKHKTKAFSTQEAAINWLTN